ncbi:DUF1192 family protein [Methylocystis bryophila]|uniref:DUF1192 domain-containing protein n=1 Tax=Methylocystis bryophila TaxID=655015 RepID=A0A1W6MRK7_9HYPH|nr:DUF1192 family protein [Methylocystis bryophila]ARN80233.1 hypothetical protein B1812_03065 [Methylocystis bryophila]BDV40189.1 hypothetical protein DSM21852_34420 [Methylocystis bryophila]
MAEDPDEKPREKPEHKIGEKLDEVSVAELDARIALLREEIARLEAARDAKRAAQAAADAFFKK